MKSNIEQKSTLRDFQRKRLYEFEESVLEKHPQNLILTLEECKLLARKYNPSVLVKDGRGRRHAGASFEDNLITLPIWSRQTVIVLHEVAHTFVDDRKYPYHGAEFVGTFIGLLSRESIGTIETNIADVCHARLKFDELWINRSPESSGYSTRPITSPYHEN